MAEKGEPDPTSPLDLEYLVRPNIYKLQPYRCARDENKGKVGLFLDANENGHGPCIPLDGELHRYPSPYNEELKEKIAKFRRVKPDMVFLGVGSDEAIDIIIRVFCIPGQHAIMVTPPTYGMYKVTADINDVTVQSVPLAADFHLDVDQMLKNVTPDTRVIFLCSPNNPTGSTVRTEHLQKLLTSPLFTGIVVVDEAYIDFSSQNSICFMIHRYTRLISLQTLSKSFGLAGIRLGMAIAHPEIISIFNNVKAPYNISRLTSKVALEALDNIEAMMDRVKMIQKERSRMFTELNGLPCVEEVFVSDANFLLFRVRHALEVYQKLAERGIIVRYRGNQPRCENCIRITISTREENERAVVALIDILEEYDKQEKATGTPPYKKARMASPRSKPW